MVRMLEPRSSSWVVHLWVGRLQWLRLRLPLGSSGRGLLIFPLELIDEETLEVSIGSIDLLHLHHSSSPFAWRFTSRQLRSSGATCSAGRAKNDWGSEGSRDVSAKMHSSVDLLKFQALGLAPR